MATKPHLWKPDRRPARAVALYNANAGRALLTNDYERGFIMGTYAERWEGIIMSVVDH